MSTAYWVWVALYLMIPVVGIVIGRAFNGRKQKSPAKLFEGETVLFSVGMVVAVLALWPLILVGFALDPWVTSVGYWMDRRRNRFLSRPEHLLGKVFIAEAENGAMVVDPLHRVPDLPFGHLHAAWQEFKQKKKFWYRLRQFSIPGTPPRKNVPQWSTPQGQKLGYAWVGLGRIKAEFIYEWN